MLFRSTCIYVRTAKGTITGGECVNVEISSTGICDTAYVYEKPSEDCEEGYSRNHANTACILNASIPDVPPTSEEPSVPT